jgi:glycosyltransferase involved in cell wall biosynthesis
MDIAFIHPDYPAGDGTGATYSATQIIRALRKRGHTVDVYCTTDPGSETNCHDVLDTEGFPHHTRTRIVQELTERAAELATYDVVHSYITAAIPALHRLPSDVTTIATLNSYAGICPKNDLRYMDSHPCQSNGLLKCTRCSLATSGGGDEHSQLYRSLSRLGNLRLITQVSPEDVDVDGFQALSHHVKDTYEAFGYPGDRISVIPNILDEKFLVDHQSDFEEPYKLLYVGYLKKHKGVDRLPEILDRVRDQSGAHIKMSIVGAGGLRNSLETDFNRRDLSDSVKFHGKVPNDDLPKMYATHDLFVYPGVWDEPFGRVFLEALAAGTPIVGSDVGALADIVGEAGVVADSTPEALAHAIIRLLEEKILKSLSKATRVAAAEYDSEAVAQQFEHLYTEAAL